MFEDQKPSYTKRNSFTMMGAVGLQAPLPKERRQSFTQMGSTGFFALQALIPKVENIERKTRADSFEQSTLVF
jgi:hypothetical protein